MALKVAVIGAGPAGYPAALAAARLGAEVTVFEKDLLGGVCLNSGCIPSKSLLDAAHRFDAVRDIARFCEDGAETQAQALLGQLSWPKIQARQLAVTRKLTGGIGVLFKQAKINVVPAAAAFKDAHTLTARTAEGTKEFSFDYIIIAAGSTAFVPPPFDKIRDKIYDNSNIFQIPRLPKRLAIIGGGVIGCEFASLMSSLNVEVSVVEMQPRLLPAMEESLSRLLAQKLQKKGVHLLTGKQAADVRLDGDRKIISLSDGTELEADDILVAIGRSCDLTDLHPENAGLAWNRKGLQGVNPQTMQVKDHIYAAGDVTGFSLLGHLKEMASSSKKSVIINYDGIKKIEGAEELARFGFIPEGAYNNRDFLISDVEFSPDIKREEEDVLFDPQTSGGLLLSLKKEDAQIYLSRMKEAFIVGCVVEEKDKLIKVMR